MGTFPVMVFVREGCPYCSRLMEELARKRCGFCALNIDNKANMAYLSRLNMLVKAAPLIQTPNNFYVLHDFFEAYALGSFNEALLDMIMQDMEFMRN
ncbi:glutaredoxin domain-containing protein [Methanolobus psychrotolerans]|uniref:glutaredoxin domain-containing protein n=1 Tax=Methanolobus psychrotolerans TaxID=1874706 RepID=UPI000B915535|nr:glutaredoxin domain-containing protein [Methanolobus psychrotolerans]